MTLSTSSTSSPLGVLSVLVLGMIALLLSPRLASAQVATASINGAVGDASGAGVPRARVVLRNEATNVTQTTTTGDTDRKSTRLNSSHGYISYAVFCLKKKQ